MNQTSYPKALNLRNPPLAGPIMVQLDVVRSSFSIINLCSTNLDKGVLTFQLRMEYNVTSRHDHHFVTGKAQLRVWQGLIETRNWYVYSCYTQQRLA